MTDDQERS